MATLHFKGKSAVWNHHLSVPYQTLDPVAKMSHKGKDEEENLIIEGDNLTALKSLLPKYQGKIKCIYIDPPYNTGNEGWVYSDNVSNPIIKSWIGVTVGKEGEDLTRHDKWLCMMTPRMKLLRELLSEDGVIFVSIDDNEVHHLRCLLNDIYGPENFIGELPRITKKSGKSSNDFTKNHDYVIGYRKSEKSLLNRLEHIDDGYKHKDEYFDERGLFKLNQTLDYSSIQYSRSLDYEIEIDGEILRPGGVSEEEMNQRIEANPKTDFCWRWSRDLFDFGLENDFIVVKQGRDGKRIYTKTYQNVTISQNDDGYFLDYQSKDKAITSLDLTDNIFSNDNAKKKLREIFGETYFEYPKPPELIKELLYYSSDKHSIVLDSFAGSGTTAQAVLELNKEDGGNRKFILVQIPEETGRDSAAYKAGYKTVQEITQARVKKVIERDGLDVGFTYYKLGQQIDADGILAGDLPNYDDFAKYVYYLATGKNYPTKSKVDAKKYFVAKDDSTAVFLVYENDFEKLKSMALTLDLAKDLHKQHDGRKIVYAPACFLDEHHLDQFNITFVGIPFNLFERN